MVDFSDLTPEEMRRDLPDLMTMSQIAKWWRTSKKTAYRKIVAWQLIEPALIVEQPCITYHGTVRKKAGPMQVRRDPLLKMMGSDPRGEVNEEIWRTSRSVDVIRIEQKRMIQRVQALESENLGVRAQLRVHERDMQELRAMMARNR